MTLRKLRQKRGLTQQELAERVHGVNQSRVAGYENGRYDVRNMTLGTLLEVLDAVGQKALARKLRTLLLEDSTFGAVSDK
ncbi:helix-turn-helix transcriptional regulator [Bifidobacterium avesanii]|nr:helix-turn-helix transcriptional regulator [Bifidobacterium avesanii]KAB8293622.1 PbsX family transcriptional regulator [Bifidobacterium avesanii]